jgi:hypothetical protein
MFQSTTPAFTWREQEKPWTTSVRNAHTLISNLNQVATTYRPEILLFVLKSCLLLCYEL